MGSLKSGIDVLSRRMVIRGLAVSLVWFSAISWAQSVPGVTPTTILLGQTVGLTGPQSAIAEMVAGANTYWNALNAKGGVHGRTVTVKTVDDGSSPKRAGENAEQLIARDNVFALFLGRGTPQGEAAYKFAEAAGVPMVAQSTGAATFYNPKRPLVFTVRAPYQYEVEKIIEHFVSTGVTNISIVHVDDAFGKDAFASAVQALTRLNLKPASIATWDTVVPDVPPVYATTKKANPGAVLVVGALKPTTELLKRARADGFSAQFATLSNNSSSQLIKDLGAAGHGLIVSQVQPSPYSPTTAIGREFQAASKAANAPISYLGMEGYIGAKVMAEALRRAGRDLTRAKLMAALETLSSYDVGGVTVTFGPGIRTGSRYVDLSMISKDGKFMR